MIYCDPSGFEKSSACVRKTGGKCVSGIPNNPKKVRRFMSKQEYKQFKKKGFVYNPNDPRGGISTTSTKIAPINPDKIKKRTGALGADKGHFDEF